MKKITVRKLNGIEDDIESFLKELSDKDKRECGIDLCMFIASVSAADPQDDVKFDMLEPASILYEARERIIEVIDREFLDILGEECVKVARKNGKCKTENVINK